MDIEEIKEILANPYSVPTHELPPKVSQALLWIIEKLQEQPTIQVAHLEDGDVIVAKFDRPVPTVESDRYRQRLEAMWPDNYIIITEGIDLMVVREPDVVDVTGCTCRHQEGCPSGDCDCGAEYGEAHVEDCPIAVRAMREEDAETKV